MEKNFAFIDWQNLHLGLKSEGWFVDLKRFRVWLKDKFQVQEAYYFLWFISEEEQELYHSLQKAWFIVSFKEHTETLKWKKKWNVDVDIVFEMMRSIIENEAFNKIVLVSGDGDYIKVVKYLIAKWRFKKILFPNKKYSSLYRPIQYTYGIYLGIREIKKKIEYKKRKRCP